MFLLYSQVGYYGQTIFLQWRMKEAAREARIAALPDKVLERISAARVQWAEEGKECWYEGHLYDVIRQRTADGSTWLYCLDDEREERLIAGSVDVTRATQDQPGRQTRITFSICDLLCQTPHWVIEPLPPVSKQYISPGVYRLSSCYARVVIPPPKGTPVLFC